MATPTEHVTWELLCKLESRLLDLYREAEAVKDDGKKESFCANAIWYGRGDEGLKEKVCDLVGWEAGRRGADPRLCTTTAYDIGYHTIYDVLPPCRNCICFGWNDYISDVIENRTAANAYGAKERPRCRRSIIESDLRPNIEKGKWTGWAVAPDARRVHLSDGMRTQMRLMMGQRYWGQEPLPDSPPRPPRRTFNAKG